MITESEIRKVGEIIERYQRFAITTHVNPDGDGLGSEAALAAYLKQRKKEVRIFNSSEVPDNLKFLDPNNEMALFNEAAHVEYLTSADVLFILDISDWERLRKLGEFVKPLGITKVCIDHHLKEAPFVELDIVHPEASSTGELIYNLLTGLKAKMSKRISNALFAAILTDTGGFRFSNTTASVHKIAANLYEIGIDAQSIFHHIYESQPASRIRLLTKVLNTISYHYNQQLAAISVTQKMLHETGTTLKDIEGFADFPRSINGVEVSLLFAELADGRVKISFRSKGNIEINSLARKFAGGGHAYASGATVKGDLQEAINKIISDSACARLFEREKDRYLQM